MAGFCGGGRHRSCRTPRLSGVNKMTLLHEAHLRGSFPEPAAGSTSLPGASSCCTLTVRNNGSVLPRCWRWSVGARRCRGLTRRGQQGCFLLNVPGENPSLPFSLWWLQVLCFLSRSGVFFCPSLRKTLVVMDSVFAFFFFPYTQQGSIRAWLTL